MKKESQVLQLLIGCFSIIGAIFTILGFIVAVLMVFYQQPIYVFLESVLPTPTAAAGVVSAITPATALPPTTTQVPATATPITANEQNPPPGTIVPAGQPITKGRVSLTLEKRFGLDQYDHFGIVFTVENKGDTQIIVSFRPTSFKITDDLGNEYTVYKSYAVNYLGRERAEEALNRVRQAVVDIDEKLTIEPDYQWFYEERTALPFFEPGIDPNARYLIIEVPRLAGMEDVKWRYDLP